LFGIDRHVEGEPIVITEGTTDALNLWRHGVRHPVAILGASLSAGQAQLIAQRTSTVYAMGDGDDAGRKMADEVCRTLGALGCNVQIVGLPDGRDPGDLTAAEVGEFFAGSGETPLTSNRNMVSNELFTAL
jgi:DNA primase